MRKTRRINILKQILEDKIMRNLRKINVATTKKTANPSVQRGANIPTQSKVPPMPKIKSVVTTGNKK